MPQLCVQNSDSTSLVADTKNPLAHFAIIAQLDIMGMRLVGAVLVAFLLLLVLSVLRMAILFVRLVTLRYTLAIGFVTLTCWFVNSRRRRYARGFYSCSRVPQTNDGVEREREDANELWFKQQDRPVTFAVPSIALETVPDQLKVVTAPPSETESEDDDSESGRVVSVIESPTSDSSRHSMSSMDVRTHRSITDSDLQWQKATRPRSSSAAGDSRSITKDTGMSTSYAKGKERKHREPRRRADTGTASYTKQAERSRRATFASKPDARALYRRSTSEKVEDALRLDGYWIGDFRVQRRVVSRSNHANNPKTNQGGGERR